MTKSAKSARARTIYARIDAMIIDTFGKQTKIKFEKTNTWFNRALFTVKDDKKIIMKDVLIEIVESWVMGARFAKGKPMEFKYVPPADSKEEVVEKPAKTAKKSKAPKTEETPAPAAEVVETPVEVPTENTVESEAA